MEIMNFIRVPVPWTINVSKIENQNHNFKAIFFRPQNLELATE